MIGVRRLYVIQLGDAIDERGQLLAFFGIIALDAAPSARGSLLVEQAAFTNPGLMKLSARPVMAHAHERLHRHGEPRLEVRLDDRHVDDVVDREEEFRQLDGSAVLVSQGAALYAIEHTQATTSIQNTDVMVQLVGTTGAFTAAANWHA